jgi:hypothetical protein
MQRISSSGTFFSKRVLPTLFLGILGLFAIDAYRSDDFSSDAFVLAGLAFMAVVGIFVFRVFVWDLADEVDDHGSYLEVRRGKIVDRIEFSNIMNVSAAEYANPPRVTLRLVEEGALGKNVSFSPKIPLSFRPLATSTVVEELTERACAARARGAG